MHLCCYNNMHKTFYIHTAIPRNIQISSAFLHWKENCPENGFERHCNGKTYNGKILKRPWSFWTFLEETMKDHLLLWDLPKGPKRLKDPEGLLNGSVYWQTVTVCQLEIIGSRFTKYVIVLPISSCWQTPDALFKRAAIATLFKRSRQGASADKYFLHGLPIISNWQTVTVCQ